MAAEAPVPSREKSEAAKDPSGQYSEWANAMQAYYKTTPPPGHGHPGGYYASPMVPPGYGMWNGQPIMPPYGAPPPSPYYGPMYPPQQPPMGHFPPPMTNYPYTSPVSAQGKAADGSDAVLASGTPANAIVAVNATQGGEAVTTTDGNSTGGDEEPARCKRNYDTQPTPEARLAAGSHAYPSYPPATTDLWGVATTPSASRSPMAISAEDSGAVVPYQDEREVKRQKRKQSNRESARRSRLRKQAECEDLGGKVSALIAENNSMRVELEKMRVKCAVLTVQNTRLQSRVGGAGLPLPDGPEALLPNLPEGEIVANE